MKGLLHRLAARAAGTATTVRSDAVLPFAADGFAWHDMAMPTADDDVPEHRDPTPARQAPMAEPLAPDRAVPERQVEPREHAHTAPEMTVPPSGVDVTLSRATSSAPESPLPMVERPGKSPVVQQVSPPTTVMPAANWPDRSVPPTPRTSAAPEPRASANSETTATLAMRVAPAASPPTTVERHLHGALPASGNGTASVQAPTIPDAPAPARLLPTTSLRLQPRPWDSTPTKPLPAPAISHVTADTTEVHVHIGRIEVTAPRETPPPSQPRPRPAAPSLASYLAARSAR